MGLLRHVLRWLQWDHGVAATEVMDRLITIGEEDPGRFPHLTWTLARFDQHATAPEGWRAFYDEVRRLLIEDHGVAPGSGLDTVLALNRFLMPTPGRRFPDSRPVLLTAVVPVHRCGAVPASHRVPCCLAGP